MASPCRSKRGEHADEHDSGASRRLLFHTHSSSSSSSSAAAAAAPRMRAIATWGPSTTRSNARHRSPMCESGGSKGDTQTKPHTAQRELRGGLEAFVRIKERGERESEESDSDVHENRPILPLHNAAFLTSRGRWFTLGGSKSTGRRRGGGRPRLCEAR